MATEEVIIQIGVTGTGAAQKNIDSTTAAIGKLTAAEADAGKKRVEIEKKASAETTKSTAERTTALNNSFQNINQSVQKTLSVFGKLSKDFGVSSEAAKTLTLGFERLQIIGAVIESVKGAVVGFQALRVAITGALGPIGLILAAITSVIAAFYLFSKSSKQVRSEQQELANTIAGVSDAYRDLAKAQQNLDKSKVIELNEEQIQSFDKRKRKQEEILAADFRFTKEEIAILESGNADKIATLEQSSDFASKIQEDGAKEAVTNLTKLNTDTLKLQEENAKARLEITKAFVEAENNLLLVQLSASADVGNKIQAIYVESANKANQQLFGLSKEARARFKELTGAETFSVNPAELKKQFDVITKEYKRTADAFNRIGTEFSIPFLNKDVAKQREQESRTQFAGLEAIAVEARTKAVQTLAQFQNTILGLDNQLFQEKFRLQADFNTRQAAKEKDFGVQIQQIETSRRAGLIGGAEANRQVLVIQEQIKNSRIENLEAIANAELASFKASNQGFIENLQSQLKYLNDYNADNIEAIVTNLQDQAILQVKALDAERTRLNERKAQGLITAQEFSAQTIKIESDLAKNRIMLQDNIYNARIKNINDTIVDLKKQADFEAKFTQAGIDKLNAEQKASDLAFRAQDALGKTKIKNNVTLRDIEQSLGIAEQAREDRLKRQNDLILLNTKLQLDKLAAEKESLTLESSKLKETSEATGIDKGLKEAQKQKLADNEKQLVLVAEQEIAAEANKQNALNSVSETNEMQRFANAEEFAKRRLELITKETEAAFAIATGLQSIYKSVADFQNAQADAQIELNNERIEQIKQALDGIDATIAEKDAKLQELQDNQARASGARSQAIQTQIDNENAARARAIDARNKELENQKKIEAENARLANEKAQREKTNARVQIAIDTAQAYAKLGLAISAALSSPGGALNSGLSFGASAVVTTAAILSAGIAAIGSTIAAAQAFSFEKGGLIPEYASGGVLGGNSHKQGGIGMYSGGKKVGEVEGGEVVLTKNVSRSPALLNVASAVNVAAGGNSLARTTFAAAGGIVPNFAGYSDVTQPAIDFSGMPTPVVMVSEIERVQNRVAVIEGSARF